MRTVAHIVSLLTINVEYTQASRLSSAGDLCAYTAQFNDTFILHKLFTAILHAISKYIGLNYSLNLSLGVFFFMYFL